MTALKNLRTKTLDPETGPRAGRWLSSRLDPEDLREVIAAYHRAVAQIVAGFDGFVAKYMGDGVLIYFGYPRYAGETFSRLRRYRNKRD